MTEISVATYSIKDIVKSSPNGWQLAVDYLKDMGIKNVEINNIFVSHEDFSEKVQLFKSNGITPILLTIDGNNFFQKKPQARMKQFDFMKAWIDLAVENDIKFVRANMGHKKGFLFPTDTMENIVQTFKPILEYIEKQNITLVFENHGGKSSDVDFQLQLKKNLPSKSWGYLLDFGNYRPKHLVYENILKLKNSILIAHAKTYDFDENGEETTLDVKKIIENLKKIGFDGYYSVEFEGKNLSNKEGTSKTIEILRKYLK